MCLSPGERGLAASIQGLSERLSAGNASEPAGPLVGCGAGPGLKAEPPQPSQQMLYVFSTSLANRCVHERLPSHLYCFPFVYENFSSQRCRGSDEGSG